MGGPDLARQAFSAGLVDECQLFAAPVVVGAESGRHQTASTSEFELLDERRFGNGVVFLRYGIGRRRT